jgi:hypothetical protein
LSRFGLRLLSPGFGCGAVGGFMVHGSGMPIGDALGYDMDLERAVA